MPATEISSVAVNPGISPGLHIWGWEVAAYLFLGGLVAGLMVLSGVMHRRREPPPESFALWGPLLAPVLLGAGMFALFLDLEHKLHFWRFYASFQIASPMSWGSWILLLVFPASLLLAVVSLIECGGGAARQPESSWVAAPVSGAQRSLRERLDKEVADFLRAQRGHLALANIVLGVALGIYTGILLGALGARPLWNSPVLGPLFLLSGLSSAAALLALLEPSAEARHRLGSLDLRLIAGEAAALVLMLIGLASGGAAQRAAAHLFFGGAYTALFWIGIVFTGLLLPAVIEFLHRRGRAQATVYPAVLVLLGGFALRVIILFAGQASRWEYL